MQSSIETLYKDDHLHLTHTTGDLYELHSLKESSNLYFNVLSPGRGEQKSSVTLRCVHPLPKDQSYLYHSLPKIASAYEEVTGDKVLMDEPLFKRFKQAAEHETCLVHGGSTLLPKTQSVPFHLYLPGGLEMVARRKTYRAFTHALDAEIEFGRVNDFKKFKVAVVQRCGEYFVHFNLDDGNIKAEIEQVFNDSFGGLGLYFNVAKLVNAE